VNVAVCDAYMRCFCCRRIHSPPVEVTHICNVDQVIGRPYHVEESFHGLLKTEAMVYGSAYKGNEWSMGRCAMGWREGRVSIDHGLMVIIIS